MSNTCVQKEKGKEKSTATCSIIPLPKERSSFDMNSKESSWDGFLGFGWGFLVPVLLSGRIEISFYSRQGQGIRAHGWERCD